MHHHTGVVFARSRLHLPGVVYLLKKELSQEL